MTDYVTDVLQPGQRLAILQGLARDPAGRLNEHDLVRWLDLCAYRIARDELRARLRELEARDAVRIEMPGGVLMVAGITRRGEDHVERRGAPLDGVALPPRD